MSLPMLFLTCRTLAPDHGGRQRHMRLILPGAEVLATAPVLEGHLAVLCASCPASLRMRTGVEKPAVGVAPPFGAGVPLAADDCIKIFLLRLVAVHPMIWDAQRQAMPMRAQWLRVEVDPGFFQRSLSGFLAWRRLRTGERQSAPACDLHHREGGHLQPPFGTTCTAIDEVPKTKRLLTTLCDAGRIRRREQFRGRGTRCHQHALMTVGPVKWLPTLPGDGAFRVVAVATQVAAVDTTASHTKRDEQRGQELPLGLTESGHLLQDVVDKCHKPFTSSSGSGMRLPH